MWNSGNRKVSHRRHLGAKMNSAGQLFALDAAVVKLKDKENLAIILVPLIMILSRGQTGQIKG